MDLSTKKMHDNSVDELNEVNIDIAFARGFHQGCVEEFDGQGKIGTFIRVESITKIYFSGSFGLFSSWCYTFKSLPLSLLY